jgi:UDPglucose--hexose-1-phosphate uridylyltransferase
MDIEFRKQEEWFSFQDNQGNGIERKTEIRFDPLTGESSRLIFDPGLNIPRPDYTEAGEETGGKNCPFCSENSLKLTPLFKRGITEQGRISQGSAVVFPNLFPYSKHNGVVIFSDHHYVRLEEFTIEMIKDAFLAAQTYIQLVAALDSKAKHASINWNYLPLSGGSILHPHIQVMVSDSPSNYQRIVSEKALSFMSVKGKEYFTALCETEKTLEERWIGELGDIAWLHAFAPKSHNDFIAVFSKSYSIDDIKEQDWIDFSKGLRAIFATLDEQGFASFNLMLHISPDPESKQPIHVRLIPRLTLGLLNTSDINFFHALHQEPLSFKLPEEIAVIARKHFTKIQ